MPHTALLDLSIEAGNAILDVYGSAFGSESKADGSPVTVADEAAEKIILAGLSELFPDVPVVAEEAVEAGNLPQAANRYFLVDPLDGTKEFIARNGEFTVNIALIDAGVPVFGVVYAPALGEIYWGGGLPEEMCGGAAPSFGAFSGSVADGEIGEVRSIAVRPVPDEGLTVLASRSHLSPETSALIEKLNVAEMVSVGSSLKLCWVAAAKADFYPRLAPTMQWDIGAGDAVLRAAGGEVLVAETRAPLTYQVKPGAVKADLLNPFFLAMSTTSIIESI
ncbi:3'(2'),5'-bisphosphate nucleotidase CysQ [Roseibium litorale]|uniref:3'(2'),5'-bisphosphate nucleotidase CysQ n=1 Tax=Roseibium litorale TaxID=2803841 RepID=A0ABR9CJ60_9HYPH|nr:3'(2'),5'-bisphosphate nucleotidase CysQ [Roseibium litorale]MBD8890773.1 3'(2'),5'-bisphosphate nucleotidase CysQ [Roseibium litorale]